MGSPISKSPFLKSYRNQVKDALLTMHPDWDADEVKKNIDEITSDELQMYLNSLKDYSKNRSDLNTYYNVGKLLSEAGKHYGEGIIKE